MTGVILPPDRLNHCTRSLTSRPEGGGGAAPVDRRALEPLLASALIGPVARDQYLAALGAAFGDRSTPTAVAVSEFPVETILRDGLRALSDEQLTRLGRSESAVRELNRLVDEALANGTAGRYWQEAELLPDESIPGEYHAAAEHAVGEVRRLERETRPDPTSRTDSVPSAEIQRRQWVRFVVPLALAASLLLAFYLGTFWSGKDGRQEIRLASVAVRGDVTRGIDDVAIDVANGTDRRAFLTVVGLAPGRKTPAYHYRSEGRYIEVPAGGTAAVKNLPPEFEGSTVLLVVSTHGPAGGVVREVIPPAVAPGSAAADAEQLRKALADLGIDSDVRVVALPAKR